MSRRTIRKQPRQGAHLAALRKAAGLTQAELADAVGVPQTNIAFWEFSDAHFAQREHLDRSA